MPQERFSRHSNPLNIGLGLKQQASTLWFDAQATTLLVSVGPIAVTRHEPLSEDATTLLASVERWSVRSLDLTRILR
jgi:hypothetical protein